MYKTSQPSSRRERNRLGKESDASSGGVIPVFILYTMLTLHDLNPDWCHILTLSHTVQCLEAPHESCATVAAPFFIPYNTLSRLKRIVLH